MCQMKSVIEQFSRTPVFSNRDSVRDVAPYVWNAEVVGNFPVQVQRKITVYRYTEQK